MVNRNRALDYEHKKKASSTSSDGKNGNQMNIVSHSAVSGENDCYKTYLDLE